MPIFEVLGSCRIGLLARESYIHKAHHVHNSKEAIQYIEYINGYIDIPQYLHRYVFRGCYLDNVFVIDRDRLKSDWDKVEVLFVEVCSRKKYIKDGYYIHHLAADMGDAPAHNVHEQPHTCLEYTLEIQDTGELEDDLLKLVDLMFDKKLVVVTHVDYGIPVRKKFINDVDSICKNHGITCVNPTNCIGLRARMRDSNHFTREGLAIVSDYILETSKDYWST